MKAFILCLGLIAALPAFSAELKVLDMPVTKEVTEANFSTRFEVNLQDGSIGVSATAKVRSGKIMRDVVTFETLVPELYLSGDRLMFVLEGKAAVDCGTMGKTRFLRRPVLRLSGNCGVEIKRLEERVQVYVVTY